MREVEFIIFLRTLLKMMSIKKIIIISGFFIFFIFIADILCGMLNIGFALNKTSIYMMLGILKSKDQRVLNLMDMKYLLTGIQ